MLSSMGVIDQSILVILDQWSDECLKWGNVITGIGLVHKAVK